MKVHTIEFLPPKVVSVNPRVFHKLPLKKPKTPGLPRAICFQNNLKNFGIINQNYNNIPISNQASHSKSRQKPFYLDYMYNLRLVQSDTKSKQTTIYPHHSRNNSFNKSILSSIKDSIIAKGIVDKFDSLDV
jgi:hypothetical protein